MSLKHQTIKIPTSHGLLKCIVLTPKQVTDPLPGILWIHGGGYMTGMSEMVYVSRAKEIAETYGAIVVSPNYTLSYKAPYPAALKDCYKALVWMVKHADELHIRTDQIIVGGESAGGGLCAALCMLARDLGNINIAFQLPLYPMIDCDKTESNQNNHGYIWNTRRNNTAWKVYLRGVRHINEYASPARRVDYSNLPPCYTFVTTGEPFYSETIDYVNHLQQAGIDASLDIYEGKMHAFDLILPMTPKAKKARKKLLEVYGSMVKKYFVPQAND
ncbi:MAG: alpha/beta hydrolase [Erysipelotrichaceae bacterium]|nr:alpha/beta hydrolase [Erysipelotrichaceae bacterium]